MLFRSQHAAVASMARTPHVQGWSTCRSAVWMITHGSLLASSSTQKIARRGTTLQQAFLTTSGCLPLRRRYGLRVSPPSGRLSSEPRPRSCWARFGSAPVLLNHTWRTLCSEPLNANVALSEPRQTVNLKQWLRAAAAGVSGAPVHRSAYWPIFSVRA